MSIQLMLVIAVGAAYFVFIVELSLILKTESCYKFYLRTPDSWCNYRNDLDDYQEKLRIPKTT